MSWGFHCTVSTAEFKITSNDGLLWSVGWHSEVIAKGLTKRYGGGEEIFYNRFALSTRIISVPKLEIMTWK